VPIWVALIRGIFLLNAVALKAIFGELTPHHRNPMCLTTRSAVIRGEVC
jgi:hypothetical protein